MPLRSTLLNQGKFEEESCIAQPNIFAMLCGEAPCEAVHRPYSDHGGDFPNAVNACIADIDTVYKDHRIRIPLHQFQQRLGGRKSVAAQHPAQSVSRTGTSRLGF
jgi:hypothetical protein